MLRQCAILCTSALLAMACAGCVSAPEPDEGYEWLDSAVQEMNESMAEFVPPPPDPQQRAAFIDAAVYELSQPNLFSPAQAPQPFENGFAHHVASKRYIEFEDGTRAYLIVNSSHFIPNPIGPLAVMKHIDSLYLNQNHHCLDSLDFLADEPTFGNFEEFKRLSGYDWESLVVPNK